MPNSEHTYIDLLRGATGKCASWDPEITVKCGDYGRITQGGRHWMLFWRKKGARFVKEGNIYTDGKAAEYGIPDPVEGGRNSEGEEWVVSENAMRVDASLFGGIVAQCEIKGAFNFSSGRGAILAMDNMMITNIDSPGALKRVLEDPSMRGFYIVSEVQSCSSYARLLTTNRCGGIALGLRVPSGGASIGATAKWIKSAASGNFKSHVNKSGERSFYPLYRLVSLTEEGKLT